jgi:hypothetical protein
MSDAALELRIYAESLINAEMTRNASLKSISTAIFVVIEKMGPNFAALMGTIGFRALLSRALVLANADVAWLSGLHVGNDGFFEGLTELQAEASPEEIYDGGIVLLVRLLGLLVALIGKDLTLQLLGNFHDIEISQED